MKEIGVKSMFTNRGYSWYIALFAAIFFIIIPFYLDDYAIDLIPWKPIPVNEEIKSDLKSEYEQIQPFPGATLTKMELATRNGNGSIISSYSSKSNLQNVLNYYDEQFKNRGWTFKQIAVMRNTGIDTGVRQIQYTKGQYLAEVGYHENDRIGQNNTFAVAIWFNRK